MKEAIEVFILGRPSWLTLIVWTGVFALIGLPFVGLILAALHCVAMFYWSPYEDQVLAVVSPWYNPLLGEDD